MKTLTATYKGGRIIELSEEITLPKDTAVIVIVTDEDDETRMKFDLRQAAEMAFARLWDNDEDEIWNEYLQTA